MGIRVQVLKNWKLSVQNLTKEWEYTPVVILQQASFYNIFLLCLWLRIIGRPDQSVQFMNFASLIFFLIPFYMAVASNCRFEKVCRTMHTAIVLYLHKHFYSFSSAELNSIESEDKVFDQRFSCEESDYRYSADEDIEQLYIWQVK